MQTHIFRVKLMSNKRVYRDIEISSSRSLYQLAEAIIGAFDFSFDHAFGFYSSLGEDYLQSPVAYELFADMEDADAFAEQSGERKALSVKRTKIAAAFTQPKQKMLFLFDYGDQWRFEIELRGFGETVKDIRYPRILASKGTAPAQYPEPEDDDFEDEDDEDDAGAENERR